MRPGSLRALRWIVLAAIVGFAVDVRAQDPSDEAKDAGKWIPELAPSSTERLQRRQYELARAIQGDAGYEHLARGDFYVTNGLSLAGRYWINELVAPELAISRYYTVLNGEALAIRRETGYVPDAQPPGWLFRAGARFSLGYGKILVFGGVLHLSPQAFARLALLTGEPNVAPGLDLGVGLLVHVNELVHVRLDLAVFPHVEKRTTWVPVIGVLPLVSVGIGGRPWGP